MDSQSEGSILMAWPIAARIMLMSIHVATLLELDQSEGSIIFTDYSHLPC